LDVAPRRAGRSVAGHDRGHLAFDVDVDIVGNVVGDLADLAASEAVIRPVILRYGIATVAANAKTFSAEGIAAGLCAHVFDLAHFLVVDVELAGANALAVLALAFLDELEAQQVLAGLRRIRADMLIPPP
jgi:hypothetical protein